jgi:transcriptional regulator with XRE-family HTH domain
MIGADPGRLQKLGQLLMWRRAALGHSYRPAFLEEQDVNGRMVSDIERGRRDTYTGPTLEDLADAYAVTYDSMLAVAWGRADELTPAPDPGRLDADRPPFTDPDRIEANRPWRDEIKGRLDLLRARGTPEPSGRQLFPDAPDDARAWDGIGARLDIGDRVWFIADLRRRADGRDGNSGTGTAGA